MSYLHFTSELCSPDQMPFMKHSDFWLTSRDLSEKENANSFFAENRTRDGQYQSGRLFFTPQGKGIEDELRTSILNMFGPIHIQFHFCENYWGSGRNYFLVEFKANSTKETSTMCGSPFLSRTTGDGKISPWSRKNKQPKHILFSAKPKRAGDAMRPIRTIQTRLIQKALKAVPSAFWEMDMFR